MKTMKRLTLVLGLLLVATTVHAQLLWKVTGNGLGRPSYILGTHHMAPSTMIDQIKGMNEAIAGCDIVVGEVEKDSLMSPEVQARMAQAMVAPLDSTLDKVLTPADYGIVEKVFNKYFGTLIDVMVQTRANEAGRPSVGLENVDEQINLLFNGSIANQAKGLVEACKQDEFFQVQSAALADAYLAQDLDKLLAVMTDATMGGDSEEEMEVLIYSRNRSWAEKLKVIMPERACLVCVGAGHLPGEQGLLQLLRDAGYTVEPMQ